MGIDKIKSVFVEEFPGINFDVYNDNGLVNPETVLYTIFFEPVSLDGDYIRATEVQRRAILSFAEQVFTEVFGDVNDDYLESFIGLVITE